MTWGQLRFLLQAGAPDVSLDLIDGWLNTRYEKVLQATDWQGISAHTTIQTTAAYQSVLDTVTLTVGSAAVTGAGTAWTTAINGQQFYRPGDEVTYTATYVSATSLTLDRPYEGHGDDAAGAAYAGSAYVFVQAVYPLPADCSSVIEVINPMDGLPMEQFTPTRFARTVGTRTLVADPEIVAVYDDSAETAPPVLHQVEFYPPPQFARGFVTNYRRAALGFDGGNTSGSPLPFVGSLVLIVGVRADIATHLEKLTKALKYEKEFEGALADLMRVEHQQRKVKPVMQMASRFTRHRIARVERGRANSWRGGTPGGPD
jgi:hypothetical protein